MKLKLNLKKSVLIFFFFLLLSGPLFSDVLLTDQEYDEIMSELDKSEKALEISNNLLEISNRDLMTSNKTIILLEKETEILKSTTIMLQGALDVLNKSYEMQKTEKFLNDLGWFAAGFAVGLIPGGYAGFKIGITIPIQ